MLAFDGGSTIYMLIAMVVLYAATYALMAARKQPVSEEDSPGISASRGAYVPLLIGRARLGEVFCWLQPDGSAADNGGIDNQGQVAAGKGSGGGSVANYHENGLHAICVGPASRLFAILQNGKTIWSGPISPQSHPSGSLLTAGAEGYFRVYWGFSDDPAVDLLAAASNHGLTTRYPLSMKVLWSFKALGNSRQWPRLEYIVEAPCHSFLANTSPQIPEAFDDANGILWNDPRIIVQGSQPPGIAADFRFFLKVLKIIGGPENTPRTLIVQAATLVSPMNRDFDPTGVVGAGDVIKVFEGATPPYYGGHVSQLANGARAAGEYFHVVRARYYGFPGYLLEDPLNPGVFIPTPGVTEITIGPRVTWEVRNQVVETFDPLGQPWVMFCRTVESSAINPVHMLSQLLFAPSPYGAGRDREDFDLASMEEAALIFAMSERYHGYLAATDGEDAQSAIARLLQDIGMFISWEPEIGKYVFKVVRNAGYLGQTTSVAEIPAEMSLEIPEILSSQGPRSVDKMVYRFTDRARNYRDNTISIDDDGQASQEQTQHQKTTDISTTNDFDSAVLISRRRAQEALANQSALESAFNHETRWMYPGIPFFAPAVLGDEIPLRVIAVKRETHTGRVMLRYLVDSYDPPKAEDFGGVDDVGSSAFGQFAGGLPTDPVEPIADKASSFLEVPKILSEKKIKMIFPHIRGNTQTNGLRVWLSRDDTTYQLAATDVSEFSGGVLLSTLDVSKSFESGVSVSFQAYGPPDDILKTEDLTAAPESFYAGRQLALIGNELCYLQSIDPQGDGVWGLKGLIRGRQGSLVANHAAGEVVYIFRYYSVRLVESLLMVPGRTLYMKLQPWGPSGALSLDLIPSRSVVIRGDAIRPGNLSGLRLAGFRTDYPTGSDAAVTWCYRSTASPRTGAGMQGCGDPVGSSAVQGTFRITILKSAVAVRQTTSTTNSFLYTAAMRTADGVSDSDPWTIRVENIEAGYASDPLEATFQTAS